jgi:four helix bundle protein
MMPYEKFTAWQACHELVTAVYRATEGFPKEERYGLTSQMRRAAFSAAVNIAEGAAKKGSTEFRRYLDIALGSLSELSYVIVLTRELGLLERDEGEHLSELRTRAGQLTWGLYRAVSRRAGNVSHGLSVRQSAGPAVRRP